jgi:vacuolar-type H+-ATPase subunit I/STV1
MAEEFEEKFVKPIVNASYPGTLAGLMLAVLQITTSLRLALKMTLLLGSLSFTLSAFFIFFYTIYPTRKRLWTLTAIAFLFGLCCAIIAGLMLFYDLLFPPVTS